MAVAIVTRGNSELSLRFDAFPAKARARIEDRIRSLTERLDAAVEEKAPKKTGKLRSEITSRIYSDQQNRVAGYVSVYAPQGGSNEYAKAATLQYGTDLPRRIPDHGGIFRRLGKGQKRIESRLTKPVHIEAFHYLTEPFKDLEPEFRAELQEALDEAVAEGNA